MVNGTIPEDTLIFPSRVRPRRICDIYDFFAPHINVLTYLLTYSLVKKISYRLKRHKNYKEQSSSAKVLVKYETAWKEFYKNDLAK